jgi:DNA-binding NarL/FixJ family response regulator
MKLEFCVACGSKDDLQHRHLVTKAKGGSDAEPNRITLCTSCHDKLLQRQRNGAYTHSKHIKIALAARRARGASIGRPKKLMPDQRKEVLQRLELGEPRADVARSYGLSVATINRMVRSARLSGGISDPRN